jgi:hypothetical protein
MEEWSDLKSWRQEAMGKRANGEHAGRPRVGERGHASGVVIVQMRGRAVGKRAAGEQARRRRRVGTADAALEAS